MVKKIKMFILGAILVFGGCNPAVRLLKPAVNSISADDMKRYISVLASDDFLGRAPATAGEVKTINYLAGEFKKIGLKPANKGSYFQEVSLVKITADPDMKLNISGGKQTSTLNTPMILSEVLHRQAILSK